MQFIQMSTSGTLIDDQETVMEEEKEEAVIKEEQDDVLFTPKAVGAFIRGVKGDSSVVKYKITATPGCVLLFLCSLKLCQMSSFILV